MIQPNKNEDKRTVTLTVIKSQNPAILSKQYKLDAEGNLEKIPGGGMLIEGVAQRQEDITLAEFVQGLQRLKPNQALVYGVSTHKQARVVTQASLEGAQKEDGKLPVIARDRAHFSYPEGPGVLMLDYDPPKDGPILSHDELLETIYSVCPEIQHAPHIWWASASSCIYRTDTGEELRGVMGQRVYVPVKNGREIPRTGQVLFDRLWLANYGRYDVSKSGSLLCRTIVDGAVWQPERLDFAGGAACGEGLEQRRPEPLLVNPDAEFLDTSVAIPDLSPAERTHLEKLQNEARSARKPEVTVAQAAWVEARMAETPILGMEEKEIEQRREVYRRAVTDHRLLGDFVLHVVGQGDLTVGEILDNPDKYHGCRTADPLEPDYGNDPRIAWINLRAGGRPYLWSHAHGGQKFTLHRAVSTIQIQAGELHPIIERVLELIRIDGALYDRGDSLARIANGKVYPVTADWLTFYLAGLVRFEKFNRTVKKVVPCDCPPQIPKTILSMRGAWGLPKLEGITTTPTITPTGRVIETDGHDAETDLYLHFPASHGWLGIPEHPTENDVKNAIQALWHPFEKFPFVSNVDVGGCLAALLTAVSQGLIPQKPGFVVDAPAPASGKTKIAESISVLAGAGGILTPPAETDSEVGKILVAALCECTPCIVFDNLEKELASEKLNAWITALTYRDRILGISETAQGRPCMIVASGNNVKVKGDLNRRLIRIKIDSKVEEPWKREFALDPVAYVTERRIDLVRSALVILKGFVTSGFKPGVTRLGSFEVWSDFIRGAVLWVGVNGWLDVGDPVDSISAGFEQDDETRLLGAILESWSKVFGRAAGTCAEFVKATYGFSDNGNSNADPGGQNVLEEICGERDGKVNTKRLGQWIDQKRGRIVGGRCFESPGKRSNVCMWKSVSI
jgi:hypothetical protein